MYGDDIEASKPGLNAETVYDVATIHARQSMEDGNVSSVRRKELLVKAMEARQRKLNLACLVLGMTGLVLSVVAAEIQFANENERSSEVTVIKTLISISTALLLGVLVHRTNCLLVLYKTRGGMDEDETLATSGMREVLMLELFTCAVHAPPFVEFVLTVNNMGGDIEYSFTALCSLWQMFRLYLIVSVFNDLVGYRTAQARVIAKWNNVAFDAAFAFKALMERAPLTLLVTVMLALIFVLGYCLRVLERPLCATWNPVTHPLCTQHQLRTDPESITNLFWFVIITMTTVGYGDMFPLTHLGRTVAVVTCFVGVGVIALLVTVITSMSTFRPDEMRAFNALYRNSGRRIFQNSAAKMMQACWIYSRGLRYAERLRKGDDPDTAAQAIQNTVPSIEARPRKRRGSAARAVRRLSQTMGAAKYSVANGNLHMRHRSRFGKAHLLRSLRQWKRDKAAYLSLTREKSEVAMVVKEILDVRGRLNEMNEELERHSEFMNRSTARLERIENMMESIAMHLKVPLAPAKRLAPLHRPSPSPLPDQQHSTEVKPLPRPASMQGAGVGRGQTGAGVGAGAGAGMGAGATSTVARGGGIKWQWDSSASLTESQRLRNAEAKLAPLHSTHSSDAVSPVAQGGGNAGAGGHADNDDDDDDDDLLGALPGGLAPTVGPVTSFAGGTSSRRKLAGNQVVPLGRIGALNSETSQPTVDDVDDIPEL